MFLEYLFLSFPVAGVWIDYPSRLFRGGKTLRQNERIEKSARLIFLYCTRPFLFGGVDLALVLLRF